MSIIVNEGKSTAIDISVADQTVAFNSLLITTTGTLKYDDRNGNTITISQNLSVGKLGIAGTKIYKTGTTITGIALDY